MVTHQYSNGKEACNGNKFNIGNNSWYVLLCVLDIGSRTDMISYIFRVLALLLSHLMVSNQYSNANNACKGRTTGKGIILLDLSSLLIYLSIYCFSSLARMSFHFQMLVIICATRKTSVAPKDRGFRRQELNPSVSSTHLMLSLSSCTDEATYIDHQGSVHVGREHD